MKDKKEGPYPNIFDFIKRINQRTVNKKTLESLAYAGGFDCFPEHHRANILHVPEGETVNGLEKIIKYGQVISTQNANNDQYLVWRSADHHGNTTTPNT